MGLIRSAIIGTGFMGRVHLEAVRRLGSVEPVLMSHADFGEALQDPEIEVVHLCTPNVAHAAMAEAALRAGKHVLCEKPLATSSADALRLKELAMALRLRHCTCHNLRYYPQVQQIRAMREAGELGEILVVQGTYSQDWLLYETDWNWRIDPELGGPSRALADIGSHWCDLAEHVTGHRITRVCADLQTFHRSRRRPTSQAETFAGSPSPDTSERVAVTSEDFASVLFHLGERARGAYTVSQVSAGRKNHLSIEIHGSRASVAWNQERPDELWIGQRDASNRVALKDPSLLLSGARPFADLPGGHSEGYADTFKQLFRRFYASVSDRQAIVEYPDFTDGLRQLQIVEAELLSHRERRWVDLAS